VGPIEMETYTTLSRVHLSNNTPLIQLLV